LLNEFGNLHCFSAGHNSETLPFLHTMVLPRICYLTRVHAAKNEVFYGRFQPFYPKPGTWGSEF